MYHNKIIENCDKKIKPEMIFNVKSNRLMVFFISNFNLSVVERRLLSNGYVYVKSNEMSKWRYSNVYCVHCSHSKQFAAGIISLNFTKFFDKNSIYSIFISFEELKHKKCRKHIHQN